MNVKTCLACGQTKPIDEFFKAGTRKNERPRWSGRCKECIGPIRRAKDAARREWRREYMQRWRARKRGDAYEPQNVAPAGPPRWMSDPHLANKRAWQVANPEKRSAHKAVENAILRGDLVRQPCERCASDNNVHAHHDDYSKPLDVMWLCHPCHMARHRELRQRAA